VRGLVLRVVALPLVIGLAGGCNDGAPPILTADMPLHLEDHLDAATVEGSELPATIPEAVEWRFDEPQPDWKVAVPLVRTFAPAQVERTADALRVTLPEGRRLANGGLRGGVYVDLPDGRRAGWAKVVVRARTSDSAYNMVVGLNRRDVANPNNPGWGAPVQIIAGNTPIVQDGSVQTYELRPNWRAAPPTMTWQRLGLFFDAREPGSIDILSVSLVPTAALFAQAGVGTESVGVGDVHRRSLFAHAPARLAYGVRVPEVGRLQVALGVLAADSPVEFRITAQRAPSEATTLLSETYADPDRWGERSVDLSRFAGQTITLALETDAGDTGTVAFWGAPTVTGRRTTDRPNVIFYVIDGGWADDMSVYGYNRRTTPYLERLAAEGAVFEHAYSNSSWTLPSTASFMTSLQTSVLGGLRGGGGSGFPIPAQAVTMAEHLHRAGYQTGVFTSNPNAGRLSSLERGVDVMRDSYVERDYTSSVELHDSYWDWRDAFPGEPYWAHFQATDVHEYEGGQLTPVAPFSGMYVTTGRRREFYQEWERFNRARGAASFDAATTGFWGGFLEEAGVDRVGFFETMRGLYDESLAHQDYQIGRLVERLRERGEWEDTLLIVAADHAVTAALWDLGAFMQDTLPPRWTHSMLRGSVTRIPLIVVWPGQIAGGQRFHQPVSMIDVLPTVLDLVGLPLPEVAQGQSLATLLRGEPGWAPRPVVLDEFEMNTDTGQLEGLLEVIDGRWGASMRIGPPPDDPDRRRPWPLLLYDVWADPFALHPVNEEHPDLVEKYTAFLEQQWKDHQALAMRFTPGGQVTLTPEQLERLRALGYIR